MLEIIFLTWVVHTLIVTGLLSFYIYPKINREFSNLKNANKQYPFIASIMLCIPLYVLGPFSLILYSIPNFIPNLVNTFIKIVVKELNDN